MAAEEFAPGVGESCSGLRRNFEPAHRRRARSAIEKASALGIKIFGDGKIRRAPGRVEIFRVERRLIGVEQRDPRKNLIVERSVEARASHAMRESARVAPGFARACDRAS